MSTKIEDNIVALSEKEDETLSTPAKELLEMWQALEIGYRIPKSMRDAMESGDDNRKREAELAVEQLFAKRARIEQEHANDAMAIPAFVKPDALERPSPFAKKNAKAIRTFTPAPTGWTLSPFLPDSDGNPTRALYICTSTKAVLHHYPTDEEQEAEAEKHRQASIVSVSDIIARTRAEAEAKAAKEAADAAAAVEAEARIKAEKRQAKENAIKEKKMYRLFSTLVVKTMSKYKKYLESEQFKRRAKEVCEIMCQKEKKSSHFATDAYDSLTPERESKLAKYVKEFVQKLLARKGIKPSSSSSSSRSSHSRSHNHASTSSSSHNSQHKHRSSQSASGHSSANAAGPSEAGSATPSTPSSVSANRHAEQDDMEIDDDDDLINELVQDATGGSETPDSAKTPQSSHLDTPFQSDTKMAHTQTAA
jgi:histone-lysine N-methyltransferase SETD2